MNIPIQKGYYKLYSGANQQDPSADKIHLGYQADSVEVIFRKDTTTYFHVPYFTAITTIQSSTLITDGAVAGPIPAMADRIMKFRGSNGDNTVWGSTADVQDGVWYCSWLYKKADGTSAWMDRNYNPGHIAYSDALAGLLSEGAYQANTSVYVDTPSTMVFEPGVYYQYFHIGDVTTKNLLTTLGGVSGEHLQLSIETVNLTDISNNKAVVTATSGWKIDPIVKKGYADRTAINFENQYIDCSVPFSTKYNLKDEFTLSFWMTHNNWSNCSSTQLVGNMNAGGYGVWYNNLSGSQLFVVPENTYGHLFYFNTDGNCYLDRSTQVAPGIVSSPGPCIVTPDGSVYVLDNGTTKGIYRLNQSGQVTAYAKAAINTPFALGTSETLQGAIRDIDENVIVYSSLNTYTFNKDLLLLSTTGTPMLSTERLAYTPTGSIHKEVCRDVKFDAQGNKWLIDTAGSLYYNSTALLSSVNAEAIGIAPDNKVWVLFGGNQCNIYNNDLTVYRALSTEGGIKINSRSISFLQHYNRRDNRHIYKAMLMDGVRQVLFQLDLYGNVLHTVFVPGWLDTIQSPTEDASLLTFTGRGDTTSYEWLRTFKSVKYLNQPQLEFRFTLNAPGLSQDTSTTTIRTPVGNLVDEAWYHVSAVLKNRNISLYLQEVLQASTVLPGAYDISYVHENNLLIGSPNGNNTNLNNELNTQSLNFNGMIDDVRIYDYALNTDVFYLFQYVQVNGESLVWNIPSSNLSYIETVERFFKHKLPGEKSKGFKIAISGHSVTDPTLRSAIEQYIRQTVSTNTPSYTDLVAIEWLDD